ncbi:MAG: hypothetical protein ACI4JC_02060 [Faecalibacterium sp.]
MKIRNVEFDFKPMRIRDAKRLQQALQGLQASNKPFDPQDPWGNDPCGEIDVFFADVLGEDYAEKLQIDTEDMEELNLLAVDFFEGIRSSTERMEQLNHRMQELMPGVQPAVSTPASPAVLPAAVPELSAQQAAEPSAPDAAFFPPRPAENPPEFSRMNRAQRRAAVRAMKGRP